MDSINTTHTRTRLRWLAPLSLCAHIYVESYLPISTSLSLSAPSSTTAWKGFEETYAQKLSSTRSPRIKSFGSLFEKHLLRCSVLEARFEKILQTALAERAYQYESPGEVGAIKSTQQIFCTTKSEVDPISILGS